MPSLDQTLFVLCWESSESLAEVSMLLRDAGHPEMNCKKCRLLAWAMKKFGVNLKHLPRPIYPRQDTQLSAEELSDYARTLVGVRVGQVRKLA